jgi:hypothetical protein
VANFKILGRPATIHSHCRLPFCDVLRRMVPLGDLEIGFFPIRSLSREMLAKGSGVVRKDCSRAAKVLPSGEGTCPPVAK